MNSIPLDTQVAPLIINGLNSILLQEVDNRLQECRSEIDDLCSILRNSIDLSYLHIFSRDFS
jgi:hypothetical protein